MLLSTSDPLTISLHDRQLEVFQSEARFRILVAGRRFGKTYLALAEIVHAAQRPNQLIWYVGPTDQQSKSVAWDLLKKFTEPYWAKRPSETHLRIDLTSGSTIVIVGTFKPDSRRGHGLDFIVLDEFASLPPQAWNEVFRPALADRKGRALFIGTPKGRNHFYHHVEYARTDPDWQVFQFTTAQGGIVSADELISAARQLDTESYRQEFEAQFTNIGLHRVYHAFHYADNVRNVIFDPALPLIWSIDFNVDPMCMLLMQRSGDEVHVFDEIVIKPSATTEAACHAFEQRASELYRRSHQRPLEVHVYGDAAGDQRRTSGVSTDWTIIRDFFNRWNGTYHPVYRKASANPLVRDRVNCVNSRLRNHLQESNILINPCCRELIRDLEQVSWATDSAGAPTSELNKSDRARTHSSDALGYYISQAFNLRPIMGEKPNRVI